MTPIEHLSEPNLSWSLLYSSRKQVRKQFPSIWNIPIRKKVNQVLQDILEPGFKMLDVGACGRGLKQVLESHNPSIIYKSMDIDTDLFHDYYNMNEIEEKFDVVVMYECIEHMPVEEGFKLLQEVSRVLKPGGVALLSTPNTYHPNRYWECTHCIPYRYDELSGLMELAGFETDAIYRIYNDAFIRRMFRMHVAAPLHRYLEVDFAKSILVQARKPMKAVSLEETIPFRQPETQSEEAVGT